MYNHSIYIYIYIYTHTHVCIYIYIYIRICAAEYLYLITSQNKAPLLLPRAIRDAHGSIINLYSAHVSFSIILSTME